VATTFVKKQRPQVGLEPTTLRLTEGFQVVAGSCGLLLTHSSFCIYWLCSVAESSKVLLRVAGFCILQTANKRQPNNRFLKYPKRGAILPDDSRIAASLDLRGDITKAKLISLEERMIRTVISLDEESKRWLDQQAREENVSTAELIRTAVRKYRDEKKRAALPLNDLLKQTSGIWKAGDGLTYQRRLRKEWQR